MKKAVLYCRVATDDYENNKLNKQEQALKEFAASRNYEIVETVKETCGGKTLDRPGINRIYAIANTGDVDAVIAENISRYGRCSLRKIADFVASLNAKGFEVITLAEGNLRHISPLLKSISKG